MVADAALDWQPQVSLFCILSCRRLLHVMDELPLEMNVERNDADRETNTHVDAMRLFADALIHLDKKLTSCWW